MSGLAEKTAAVATFIIKPESGVGNMTQQTTGDYDYPVDAQIELGNQVIIPVQNLSISLLGLSTDLVGTKPIDIHLYPDGNAILVENGTPNYQLSVPLGEIVALNGIQVSCKLHVR